MANAMIQNPSVAPLQMPKGGSITGSFLAALQNRQSQLRGSIDQHGQRSHSHDIGTSLGSSDYGSRKRTLDAGMFTLQRDGNALEPTPIPSKRRMLSSPSVACGAIPMKKSSWWKFGTLQKDVLHQLATMQTQNETESMQTSRMVSSTISEEDYVGDSSSSSSHAATGNSRSNLSNQHDGAFNISNVDKLKSMNTAIGGRYGPVFSNSSSKVFSSGVPSHLHEQAALHYRQKQASTFQSLPQISRLSMKSSLSTTGPNADFLSQVVVPLNSSMEDHPRSSSANRLLPYGHKKRERTQSFSTTDDDDGHSTDGTEDSDEAQIKFRAYQAENWTEKFEELLEFRSIHGHCLVPNSYDANQPLAQWVKRQRYQYKLKLENKRSTMSDERIQALNHVGFVWDSHSAIWNERLNELLEYKRVHGDCNVPSRYQRNRQLAVWVKRQRRQYKFYKEDSPSSMTPERIIRLEAIGFEWDLRKRGEE